MTIVQPNTAVSLTISMDNSQNVNQVLWLPVRWSTAFVRRLWWHTKGYGIIFSIMFLTLMSLIFLTVHWPYHKLLILPTSQNELDLENTK